LAIVSSLKVARTPAAIDCRVLQDPAPRETVLQKTLLWAPNVSAD
jgi:hypothetical protein